MAEIAPGARIAFLGTGIMGGHMARRLAEAGFNVAAWNRSRAKAEPLLASGATLAETPEEALEGAAAAVVMLSTGAVIDEVLFAGPTLDALKPGAALVVMSSIPVETCRAQAEHAAARGIRYVDAPVSGGEVGAKNATLSIMVGGPEAAFAKVKPLFELMGKNITLVGGNGDGQTAKVANQIIVALNIEAVAEALLFASKAGADPAKVREALMGGFASSKILEVHGDRMVKRTFQPGFRIELHQKDLNLALQSAKVLGVSLPNTATAQELFNACAAHGGSAWDHSGMIKALELMANHEIG